MTIVYIRVVEKEDPLPRAIPSWPEESSALTTSTDFYIGHSMYFLHRSLDVFVLLYSLYLHFWILCICISVTSFWISNVGISLLRAIPDQKTIMAHYIVRAEYTLTFTFLRMYFYSFSSIFYFSCSLQCNIITRHQLTTNPQIRVCQYET